MIYQYLCRPCRKVIERKFPMGQQPRNVACPVCHSRAGRFYRSVGVVYRGTGWTGRGHGTPDMNERKKLPGPLEFGDLTEER